jgi:sorting nexin-9/18/33
MSCTDEKKWKAGKRQAEKDDFVGGNYFYTVRVPQQPLDLKRMWVFGFEVFKYQLGNHKKIIIQEVS